MKSGVFLFFFFPKIYFRFLFSFFSNVFVWSILNCTFWIIFLNIFFCFFSNIFVFVCVFSFGLIWMDYTLPLAIIHCHWQLFKHMSYAIFYITGVARDFKWWARYVINLDISLQGEKLLINVFRVAWSISYLDNWYKPRYLFISGLMCIYLLLFWTLLASIIVSCIMGSA